MGKEDSIVTDTLLQAICNAMDFLSRREHTSQELRQKLTRKGFEPQVIEWALLQLRTDNLLNEDRFIDSFIYSRLRKGQGPLRIEQELRKRGISKEKSKTALDSYDHEYWQQRACEVRQKRFGQSLPKTPRERGKQMRFLQSRGFTNEQMRVALSSVC